MTTRQSIPRLSLALAAAICLLQPSAALADDSYSAGWHNGELLVTANSDFTEATIQKIAFDPDDCGTDPEETSCTWELKATLSSDPATRCNPDTPTSQVVWSSGQQSDNSSILDGPEKFPLEGCRGQTLSLSYRFDKTFAALPGQDPPVLRITGGGSTWPVLRFGFHPAEEAEKAIIAASPAATPLPPFSPNFRPPTLTVDRSCQGLTIGADHYAFAFGRMGCRKASNLASVARFGTPPAYRCHVRADGGKRCWRQGEPKKYLEWRRA